MKQTRRFILMGFLAMIFAPFFPKRLVRSQESDSSLISKTIGVDYTPLRDRLAEGNWKEAERETIRVMLQSAGRENEGWFRREDIEKIPAEDLRIIDQLWRSASEEKFGFSVQKKIWKKLGSPTPDSPIEIWRKFYIKVGWKTKESGTHGDNGYVNYNDLKGFKDWLAASPGNLPGCLRYLGFVIYSKLG